MALDKLTKVDGGGISTTSDYRVGIITASKFVGPFDGTGGNFSGVITATDANFSGNVTIGGTLTYEDVTNIDSVGIITARDGIDCNGDIDVDGHTNLDNVSIAGVTTFSGGVTVNNTIDLNGDIDVDGHTNLDNVSISGVTTSGHLNINGDLSINDNYPSIHLNDTDSNNDFMLQNQNGTFTVYDVQGNADRFEILSDGTVRSPHYTLQSASPSLTFTDTNHDSDFMVQNANGLFKIYDTTNSADRVTVASNGNVSVKKDLDVDGHTNLDNVSIAGVTTFASDINTQRISVASGNIITLPDGGRESNEAHIRLGNDGDFRMYHEDGAHTTLENHSSSSDLILMTSSVARNILFKTNGNNERLRISSNGDVTTTGASYSRANAGFTARKGDSVNITRASGTPLEINRTGNNGTIINLFKDQTIIGSVGVDGGDVWIGANGTSYSETLRITNDGHLSFGASDITKTWSLGKAMHFGVSENALWGEGDYAFHMMQNAYYNGGWKYTHTDEATLYSSADGKHLFYTAASGSADSAITWSERLRIKNTGYVGVNESSPQRYFQVTGNASYGAAHFGVFGTNGGNSYVGNTPVVTISTDGNGNAGTNDEKAIFQVGRGGGGAGAAAVTKDLFRVNLGGSVQIGGAVGSNSDIDIANTKLTIKQSANNREDGIYLERSGERRGWLQFVGGAGGVSDGFCLSTNQLGTKTDVLAFDRNGRMYFINPNSVGAWFGALSSPSGDVATINTVSTSGKEASIGFSRSNSLGGVTAGWRQTIDSSGHLQTVEHNSGNIPLSVRSRMVRSKYGINTQGNNGTIYTPGTTGFHGSQWITCGNLFPFFYLGERVSGSSTNYSADVLDVYASGHWNGYPKAVIIAHERYYKSGFAVWTFGPYINGSYDLTQVEGWGGYSGSHGDNRNGQVTITDQGNANTHSGQPIRRYTVTIANSGTYSYIRWYIGFIHTGRGVYMSDTSVSDVTATTSSGACCHMRDISQSQAGTFGYNS